MANEKSIINGSFKGVDLSILSATIEGGKKVSIKQFPNRDTQNVEELGLLPRKFILDIQLNSKSNIDYLGYRNSLLAALESPGPGELIHPLYGRITEVIAVSYSGDENLSSFGSTLLNVLFETTLNTGIPQSSQSAITQVQTSNESLQSVVSSSISDSFRVDTSFSNNFQSAADKIQEVLQKAKTATSFIGEVAVNVNQFSATIGDLSDGVNELVTDPILLADSITGLFESVDALYASATGTFNSFIGFFGFGASDDVINNTTVGLEQRSNNNNILNGAVGAASLGYAYVASSLLEFETTEDVDNVVQLLDEQYDAIQESPVDNSVKNSVTELRLIVLQSLGNIRVTLPRVITIYTLPTSVRLLGFGYYGNDDNGESIANLNNISDVSFIEGEVKVITA